MVLGAVGLLGGGLRLFGGDLRRFQRLLGLLAVDGIVDRPDDRAGVGLPLDQVVLRAAADGLAGDVLVRQARHHQDRHGRHGGAEPRDRVQPVRVGQRQVQEDRIEVFALDLLQGFPQGTRPREVELPLGVPQQHVLEQNGIRAIVFHQQNALGTCPRSGPRGVTVPETASGRFSGVGRHGCFSFDAPCSGRPRWPGPVPRSPG